MLSKKSKKNNISMIHRRLYSFPDFVPSKEREKNCLAVNYLTVQAQGILQRYRDEARTVALDQKKRMRLPFLFMGGASFPLPSGPQGGQGACRALWNRPLPGVPGVGEGLRLGEEAQ